MTTTTTPRPAKDLRGKSGTTGPVEVTGPVDVPVEAGGLGYPLAERLTDDDEVSSAGAEKSCSS